MAEFESSTREIPETGAGPRHVASIMDGNGRGAKSRYLPRVAGGELGRSFALTEPDAGADAASLETRAEPDGDHYVLMGRD